MNTTTAPQPTAEQLASTVLIGAFDSILDDWQASNGCPAWIDSADRRCEKSPAVGYLCTRHHNVAVKRWEKAQAKAEAQRAERERVMEARRQFDLPKWRDELTRIEAEINRLDPPHTMEPAAYLGNAHPSITRKRRGLMSDAKVQRMAALWARHEELSRKIRATQKAVDA